MVEIVANRNCLYQRANHVIWCPKYRLAVLSGAAADETATLLDAICADRGWAVISKEIQPDHIHLLVSIPPARAVADAVKILKGITARRLFQEFRRSRAACATGICGRPPTTSARRAVSAPKPSAATSNAPSMSPRGDEP